MNHEGVTVGQDSNSANEGDQLKHCLMAAVLERCQDWPTVTYAETHAGAGVYNATFQDEKKQHIRSLKELVESVNRVEESDPGSQFARLLKAWWAVSTNADLYPGSVLQAIIQLSGQRDGTSLQVRVTEACPDTHRRLTDTLAPFGVEPKLNGFQDEVEWLTENDNLVLLIDPFTYTSDKSALEVGHLDLDTLENLLSNCWKKSRCIVAFWCAMGRKQPEGKIHQLRFNARIRELADHHSASCRWFKYGQYCMALIGISSARSVIDEIPPADNWKKSWLSRIIKEEVE